jgi:hypothetical protein
MISTTTVCNYFTNIWIFYYCNCTTVCIVSVVLYLFIMTVSISHGSLTLYGLMECNKLLIHILQHDLNKSTKKMNLHIAHTTKWDSNLNFDIGLSSPRFLTVLLSTLIMPWAFPSKSFPVHCPSYYWCYIPYILRSNPQSVSGHFLNGKC